MRKPIIDRDNPALNFISNPVQGPREADRTAAPPATPATEAKTRRLQLLLRPSLYDRVKARAERDGTSVNEYINSVLEDATKGGNR